MRLKAAVDTKPGVQDDNQRLEELDGCLKERIFSGEVSAGCHSISWDAHTSRTKRVECVSSMALNPGKLHKHFGACLSFISLVWV
jgi:hypothetical protein